MKAFASALTAALALLTTLAPAQQLNPPPDPCCDCFEIRVEGVAIDSTFYADTKGAYTAYVRVLSKGSGSNCPSNIKVRLAAAVVKDGIVISSTMQLRETIIDGGSKVLKFTLTPEQAKLGDMWRFSSDCLGSLNENDGGGEPKGILIDGCKYQDFPLNSCSGCKPCEEGGASTAANGKLSKFSGSSSTGGFLANIGITSSMGGQAKGNLSFDVDQFANPGRNFLIANASSDFTVNRTGGFITSIVTGVNTVEVAAADAAILALDPNAFTITHKDPSGNAFRTTTISFVTEAGIPRLRMDTTYEGATTRYEQTKPQADTLILEEGRVVSGTFEPLSRNTMVRTQPSPGVRVERRTLAQRATSASAWVTISDIEETWEKQYSGWVQIKEVNDPAGAALTSTWTYYQPGEHTGPDAATDGIGMLKLYTRYDGYTSFHTYSLNQSSVTTPYASNPSGRVSITTWDPGSQTSTETTTIEGTLVSKSVTTHSATSQTNINYTSATGTLTTVTHYVPSGQDFGGKPLRTLHPDGTLTTYSYARNSGGGFTTVSEKGSTTNGTSVSQGMRSISTTNSRGTTILSKTEAVGYGPANGLVYDLMAVTSVDNLGRALTTAHHPTAATVSGEVATASSPAWTTSVAYSCCGISSQTDMYGITTYFAYDHLQRQIKSNRLGVTSETQYNGLTTETHRYAETVSASLSPVLQGTSATLVSKSVSNLSGTLQESWSPDPTSTTAGALVKSSLSTTTYVNAQSQYLPINLGTGIGSRTVTTTPDGFTQTTDSFLDGRTAKTYGDLSPAMQYAYTVNATGEVTSQSFIDGTNLRETTTNQSDWAGRTLRMDYMDGAFSTMEYNNKGQMVKSTDPDGVTTLMAYNEEGEQSINAIDLNANGVIDYGVDTVSSSESDPATDSASNPVMKSISKVWQPGDTNPAGGTVVSTSLQSVNGLISASQSIGVANPSTSVTTLNGGGSWTSTSTAPDGNKSVSTYTDGKMSSMASLTSNNAVIESQTHGYDALNRPVTSTHSRTGASTTIYLSATADIVTSVSDAGGRSTAFVYDIRGRQVSVDAPDSVDSNNQPLTNVTTTTYNPDNTVAETDGDQTYRVSHNYDYADRQISMTTYGTTTATTTWQYSATRGFLLAKRDAANKGVTYTRTAAGRLATRTWARGVTTTYSYDSGGRMVSTNYSDATPDITIAYDTMGRQTSQSNGVASSAFSYNSSNLQIDTETIAYNLDGQPGADFTRVIDRSQDNLGRDIGWTLGAPTPSSAIDNQVEYQYSATDGRLATVRRGDIPVPQEFNYTYTPNSSLIASITSPAHTVSYVYETTRNVLDSKVNKKLDTTTVSSYFYTVNNYGQRTGVTTGGTAFTGSPSWLWGYNSKGEVVKADSSEAGLDRAYAFDGIGNRTSGGDQGSPISYTANALNQYSAIGSLTPVHDDDGNATAYPLPANLAANSSLVWDAENRLISATVTGGNSVTFVYDSQSRRISETVDSATTVYIYDGWNPIAEYQGSAGVSPALSKTYTWGIDLSGSMQGAGGVGGLLMVTVGSPGSVDRYFPTFDGNGNVSEYLDSTGNIVAHYEYDPFGKTTVATGLKANDFAHRFSTKPLDLTTKLYYYGYRFYDPETGRWPSRDPIEEAGGINLYGFVGNDGVKMWDVLGLSARSYGRNKLSEAMSITFDTYEGYDSGMWISIYRDIIPAYNEVNFIWWTNGASRYHPGQGMYLQKGDASGVVIHESVHAFNNESAFWGRPEQRIDEGMGHAYEAQYNVIEDLYKLQNDMKKTTDCKSLIRLSKTWYKAWFHVSYGSVGEAYGKQFFLDNADFNKVNSVFKVKLSCQRAADKINKWSENANKCCVKFVCESGISGWDASHTTYNVRLLKNIYETLE